MNRKPFLSKRFFILLGLFALAALLAVLGSALHARAQAAGGFLLISAGQFHTCFLRSDGSAGCLGAVASPPPGVQFTQISSGRAFACGLKSDGSLACWGYNTYGQAPATRAGPFTQVSAGYEHACALKTDGSIDCWGSNEFGQLAATELSGTTPGPFTQVSTGFHHTCGIKSDGSLACWGANGYGQTNAPSGTFLQVSAGPLHTCGIKTDGSVACWGENNYGQAPATRAGPYTRLSARINSTCGIKSDGSLECWGSDPAPAYVAGPFTQVSAGQYHTCALKTDGQFTCWRFEGDLNEYGQAPADSSTYYTQFSAGENFTCGLRLDGTAACWGANDYGQANAPAGVFFTQVSAGGIHACGIKKSDGSLACWGENNYGQMNAPAGAFTQVSTGFYHTCGIKSDGSLACWGRNNWGQASPPGGTFTQVSAGLNHTCGIKSDGNVDCWGGNTYGQSADQAGDFVKISAGYRHSCAIKSDDSGTCWGANNFGQAPNSFPTSFWYPVWGYSRGVTPRWSQVSAGEYHTCAMHADEKYVFCWGYNYNNQSYPPEWRKFDQFDVGNTHGCATGESGLLECWGKNDLGQAPVNPLLPPPPTAGDENPPLVSVQLSPENPDGAHGWYKNPLWVEYFAIDDTQLSELRCARDPAVPPASYDELPEGPCEFPIELVFTEGGHTFYAAASDIFGNTSEVASASFQLDRTPPVFEACPAAGPFLLGSGEQPVGPIEVDASVSGLDEALSTLSGIVATDAVGSKSLTFTAFDLAGNSATQECSYQVIYDFAGFYPPVEPAPALNTATAGSALPLKFSLAGDQGLDILAAGFPIAQRVDPTTLEPVGDPVATKPAGKSGLSYDPLTGWYIYVWKTNKAWAGSTWKLTVELVDGTQHTAYFQFQ